MDIIQTLTGILRIASQLVIFAFCLQYMMTSKTTDSILLTVATGIGSLVMIFYTFAYAHLYDSDFFRPGGVGYTAITFIGWGGQVLFAVGLILLLKKAMANWKKSTSYKNDPEAPLDSGMR